MRLREQLQRTEAFCCYDERQMNEFCNSIYYTYNLTKVLKNYRGWIINRIHETDVTNYILKKNCCIWNRDICSLPEKIPERSFSV